MPLPLVPGAVAAAASRAAGTPALARDCLARGASPGETPLSVSYPHPPGAGASSPRLAAIFSSDALRVGRVAVPASGVRGLLVVRKDL